MRSLPSRNGRFLSGSHFDTYDNFRRVQAEYKPVFPCHYSGASNVFGTCSKEDIRVWSVANKGTGAVCAVEQLRIKVPNMTCNALEFTRDGQCIVTGWYSTIFKLDCPYAQCSKSGSLEVYRPQLHLFLLIRLDY